MKIVYFVLIVLFNVNRYLFRQFFCIFRAPFRVFAFAMKKEMEAKGIKIHSDKQMNEMASPRWAKLTEEQKARYKTEAKTFDPVVNKNRKLYNSLGQVIDEVEAEKKKQMEKKESENKEIHQMVEMANDLGGRIIIVKI